MITSEQTNNLTYTYIAEVEPRVSPISTEVLQHTVCGIRRTNELFQSAWTVDSTDTRVAVVLNGLVHPEWQQPAVHLHVYVFPEFRGTGIMQRVVYAMAAETEATYVYGAVKGTDADNVKQTMSAIAKFDKYSIWRVDKNVVFCVELS